MDDTHQVAAAALLLDMDGVLVDSTGMVENAWRRWAARRGLDPLEVLRLGHGSPSTEVVSHFVAPAEVVAEAAWVEDLTAAEHPVALPGAFEAMSQQVLPVAVVTSASRPVAITRLQRAGLPVPSVVVSADDVDRGKPDPAPYRKAAERLSCPIDRCVGVEDTPAGISSLRSAGARAIAVTTTFPAAELRGALAIIVNLSALQIGPGTVSWTGPIETA